MRRRYAIDEYAQRIVRALERYKKEQRPVGEDADVWVEDPALAGIQTVNAGAMTMEEYLARSDKYPEGAPREFDEFRRRIGAYLELARASNIDLLAMEKPGWLKEAEINPKKWLKKTPAERYDAIEKYRAGKLLEHWDNEIAALPEGAHCLDVGCGSGYFVRDAMTKHKYLHWQATDLARDMPVNTRSQEAWFKECGLRKPLPYVDASQDAVFLNNVLHHVDPDFLPAFLVEIARVLKPGGKLMVTEEIRPDFSQMVDHFFWPQDMGNQRMQKEWQQLLTQTHFFVSAGERTVGTFGTPGLPVMETLLSFTRA